MTKITFLILMIGAFIHSNIAWTKGKGTESGGGGGVIYLEQKDPILMDYFTIIHSKAEIPLSKSVPSYLENIADVKSFENIHNSARDLLKPWSNLPFDNISFKVELALDPFGKWKFTTDTLTAPPFFIASALGNNIKTEVAAFYHTQNNKSEILISLPIWNKMAYNDQIGLLIHEALREVQIGFKHDYDDQALQRATAIYLLCRPTSRLNYYMFYMLNNAPKTADQIYGNFADFITRECRKK